MSDDDFYNLWTTEDVEVLKKGVERLQLLFSHGDYKSGCYLGMLFDPTSTLSSVKKNSIGASSEKSRSYFEKSFQGLKDLARHNQDEVAAELVGTYFLCGYPPLAERDPDGWLVWMRTVYEAGILWGGLELLKHFEYVGNEDERQMWQSKLIAAGVLDNSGQVIRPV